MVIKIYLRRLLFAFLIMAGFTPLLQAQNAGSSLGTNSEQRSIQRLVWTGGEYALRFEVVVQREVNGRYTAHLREFTELSFIEVSLPPGRYRFQVISYNILDKPEGVSQWVNMVVRTGVQNETFGTAPELVSGNDSTSSKKDVPKSEDKKPILLFATAAWSPVLPIHGGSFGESFSPAGAGARFGAAFPSPRNLYLGAEATALWYMNTATDENVLTAGLNLLAMKWLSNKTTALNYRLGFSYIILPDTQDKFTANIGASFLWRLTGKFFLETGLDYTALLKETYLDGCIRPWIGVGLVF